MTSVGRYIVTQSYYKRFVINYCVVDYRCLKLKKNKTFFELFETKSTSDCGSFESNIILGPHEIAKFQHEHFLNVVRFFNFEQFRRQ